MRILALLSMHGTPDGSVSRPDGMEVHVRRIPDDLVQEDADNGKIRFQFDAAALRSIARSINSGFGAVLCEALEGTAIDRIRRAEGLPPVNWIFWDSDGGARANRFAAWLAASVGASQRLSNGSASRTQWIYTTPRHRFELRRAGLSPKKLTYVRSSTWVLSFFFPDYGQLFDRPSSDFPTTHEWSGKILAIGASDRDFRTLAQAAQGIPETIHVLRPSSQVTNDDSPLHTHPYLPFDRFVEALRVCRFVIVPVRETGASSGQTTLTMAMRMGKAVVTTDTDGTRAYVRNGRTGWLVPPGNPSALRAAILDLLDYPGRRAAMEASGRALEARMRNQSRRAFHSVLRRIQEDPR